MAVLLGCTHRGKDKLLVCLTAFESSRQIAFGDYMWLGEVEQLESFP